MPKAVLHPYGRNTVGELGGAGRRARRVIPVPQFTHVHRFDFFLGPAQ